SLQAVALVALSNHLHHFANAGLRLVFVRIVTAPGAVTPSTRGRTMKRLLTLCAGALLLVVTGCDTADTVGPEDGGSFDARPVYSGDGTCDATGSGYDYCVYLIAGQTEEVG